MNYLGGKSRLAKQIVSRIPADHVCYCEPFAGAAWILFSKEPSRTEIINDMDNELVTFWRVVQNHLQPFLDYFKYAVISRKLFELENMKRPETLTDIQRAVRYYYLQRLGFGGKTVSRTFGTGPMRPGGLNLTTIEETLLEVHWRLERVTIEHLDAGRCIQVYDRPDTFFYIDPPYFRLSQGYAHKFTDADFIRLRDLLATIKGRFLLSLNDAPEIRELLKGFTQERVSLRYSVGNSRTVADTRTEPRFELFITNFTARSQARGCPAVARTVAQKSRHARPKGQAR